MQPDVHICVTCVGGRLIYDILRALRAAVDFRACVFGIDADPQAHGRLLCDTFDVLPLAEEDPEGWLKSIKLLHHTRRIDALLPLSEGESRLASKHLDELEALGIRCSVSRWNTVRRMTDKLLMLEHVASSGLDAGRFQAVSDTDELRTALTELGYPQYKVVLKPRQGRGSRGVLIFDASRPDFERLLPNRFCGTGNVDALIDANSLEGYDFSDYIAVPYYGAAVSDVDCIARAGETIQVAVRLRQLKNPLWPTSTGHKIRMDPLIVNYASALCEAFEVDGAADFDIVPDDTGAPKLLDAGARFSGSVGGSYTAGANFPAQLVRSLLDMPLEDFHIEDGTVLRPYITMAPIPAINEADLL